jgi:hypothetical protein
MAQASVASEITRLEGIRSYALTDIKVSAPSSGVALVVYHSTAVPKQSSWSDRCLNNHVSIAEWYLRDGHRE